MPPVILPSGAVAPLECPGLLPLLSVGGSTLAIARATFAHEEIDASSLSSEDCYAVALWGTRQFAASDDAIALTAVCQAYGEAPSRRLSIADSSLAWVLDRDCFVALKEARERQAHGDDEPPVRSKTAFTYTVPDTWSGDD